MTAVSCFAPITANSSVRTTHGGTLASYASETLHVPAATRNIPQIGDIVSLVDVPSILLGENHKEGTFEREVAFATYGKKKAAINKSLIRSDEGRSHMTETR